MSPICHALAFASGTVLLLQAPVVPSPALVTTAALAGAISLAPARRWRLLGLTGCMLLGGAWAGGDALERMRRLDLRWHNSDAVVTGTIHGLVERRGDTLSFRLHGELPGLGNSLIAVRWYEFAAERVAPAPGETWRLHLRLRRPRGLHNPGLRSFERYAFRHRFASSAYVRGVGNERVLARTGPRVDALRSRLSQQIAAQAGGDVAPALLAALAVGDRQFLDDEHWRVLRRTGLSHLMAISGLHVGMVAMTAYLLGAWLGSLCNRGIGAGCAAAVLVAAGYALLAGLPIPTLRALTVVIVFAAARFVRRNLCRSDALAMALVAVLLVDPVATIDAGFWLSFGAVSMIAYATAGATQVSRGRRTVTAQVAVVAGLAPLSVLFFGEASLISPLVNFVAVPLAGVAIVPLVLLATLILVAWPPAGVAIFQALAVALETVWQVLEWLATLPFASWTPGPAPWPVTLSAIAGVCWLLAPRGWPARWLGLVMLTGLMSWRSPAPAYGALRLSLLDVGHGMAVVVRTADEALLYDTGPAWRSGADAGERIVLPYLARERINELTRIVVSHADSDHAGGLAALRARFPDAIVLAGEASGVSARPCVAGQRWQSAGVQFTVLHPDDSRHWHGNDASCVLRIDAGRYCVLLTGDIEKRAERALLQRSENNLRCDVVLAPHHGSETSSHKEFVAATGARLVLFSTAFANRWDHPRPAVTQRWRAGGAQLADTGRDGAIVVTMDAGDGIGVARSRCRVRRLWIDGCPGDRSF